MEQKTETTQQATETEIEQGQSAGANGGTPPRPIDPFRLDMFAQAAGISAEELSLMVVNRAAQMLTAAIDSQEGVDHIVIDMADEKGPIQMVVARVVPQQSAQPQPEFEPVDE